LIVDESGKVQQRTIMVDRAIGDRWLVASGLEPGERVIVEGAQKVRPGTTVKVVPFQERGGSDMAPEKRAEPSQKSN
jgi:membrane fusion protein (multidrug efflux system)